MTPEQKAKELVEKFTYEVSGIDKYNYALNSEIHHTGKQCALIACRELKRQWIELTHIKGPAVPNYWDSVKEEIKKL
jgi:hypothetical protein